ncbi:MAG: molybdopterin cofactor-binding domain-containing protein [Sporichthyaceae bacterium]
MAEPWCVALVRSPHPHAVLLEIEAGSVADLVGVQEVLTAVDLPGAFTYGPARADRPVLASGVVRHVGEPVAAVLAVDAGTARLAATRLSVCYRELPVSCDPYAAERADPIHPDGTVIAAVHLRRGTAFDPVALSFDEDVPGEPMPGATVVIEGQYALEQPNAPAAGVVSAAPCEGGVEIAVPGQLSIGLRDQVAACLDLDGPAVRLLSSDGPGDGSGELSAAVVCGIFALRHQRPVHLIAAPDAPEPTPDAGTARQPAAYPDMPFVPARRWAWLAYRHHADAQGCLIGVQARIRIDAGAYAGDSARLVSALCAAGVGPYRVENVDLEVAAVRTTNSPLPSPAGGGSEAAAFAVEAQLDRLARAQELDGLHLRASNALDLDHPLPTGQFLPTTTPALALLDRVAAAPPPGDASSPQDQVLCRGTGHASAVVPRAGAVVPSAQGGPTGGRAQAGQVPTVAVGAATKFDFAVAQRRVGFVEGLDEHGQGRAFEAFAVVAVRAVLDAAHTSEVRVRELRIAVQAPGPVGERDAGALERGARAAVVLALPWAQGPDRVAVEVVGGPPGGRPLGADADQIPVGAVMAALRSAMDAATGGDGEVVPIPGVSWSMHTLRIPDDHDGAS